jgi:hypothetical protein
MPEESTNNDKPKQLLGLSGTQTIGSALAAVTSALVGSFLGVAGTLIGAALGSIVATVGAALYARTLSSAATVAMRNIPQRRRGGLSADDGDVLAASAPAESAERRAKRVRRQFTPKTWIKIGAVSAAAFVIAMVGVTAVEFGTSRPISSLVSSTSSIDGGATGQTTTLGKALSGNATVPDKTDKSAKDPEEVPGQVETGANKEEGLTTDSSPSLGDSGSAGTGEPGADKSSDTPPADLAPETTQSEEPAPATEQTPAPEVSADSGSVVQPAP